MSNIPLKATPLRCSIIRALHLKIGKECRSISPLILLALGVDAKVSPDEQEIERDSLYEALGGHATNALHGAGVWADFEMIQRWFRDDPHVDRFARLIEGYRVHLGISRGSAAKRSPLAL